jgi:hypothetical protein
MKERIREITKKLLKDLNLIDKRKQKNQVT